MFVFAHTGLTLGATVLLAGVLSKIDPPSINTNKPAGLSASKKSPSAIIISWLESLASRVDIRILLIGSLLPDIIDKPIGRFFFRDVFNSGRIFSHTLLFLFIIALDGIILYRAYRKTWVLVLAFGTLTHLILDGMWMSPRILFWPLYGFSFGYYPVSVGAWILRVLYHVASEPWLLIPEIAGLIIIAWFTWHSIRRTKLLAFLKHGQI